MSDKLCERMHYLLSQLGQISQQRNGLSDKIEDYEWIPFFMFRFDSSTDKKIYAEIRACLEAFDGNLKWTLVYDDDQPPMRLYVIKTQKYANRECAIGRRKNARGWFVKAPVFEDELYGEEVFLETRKLAIDDVPNLLDWISKYFHLKERTYMTNYDVYDLVDYIACLRNKPDHPKTLFYLDRAIEALGSEGKDTADILEIMMIGEENYVKSEERTYLPFSQKEIIQDENVYYVYRALFSELKRLYLLNDFKAFELLADDIHNLGYDILKNDLKMPIKSLKKCLKRYWRKYDRSFLAQFICDNKN